jgi:hypothetical protein
MLIVEFKEFDQLLLAEIILGGNTLAKLMLKESEFRKLAGSSLHDNAWRKLTSISLTLSKRLQALRHQGTIDWDGFAWHIASDDDHCSSFSEGVKTQPPSQSCRLGGAAGAASEGA